MKIKINITKVFNYFPLSTIVGMLFCGIFIIYPTSVLGANEGTSLRVRVVNGGASYSKPVIVRSENVVASSLDLIVNVDNSFIGSALKYFVTSTNTTTGVVETTIYNEIVGVDGSVSLSISGLSSGTEYKFEVQYAPARLAYSEKSTPHYVVTAINAPVIDSIDNIVEEAVDLSIVIDNEFIGISADFIIEIDREGRPAYIIELTKYISSSHFSITVESLDIGEEYSFRVKYARSGTTYFSEYSNKKIVTTKSLDVPVITDITDITINSVTLVAEIDSRDGEDLDFRIRIANKTAGEIVIKTVSKVVKNNGKITFYVDGLESGTEYAFRIKYSSQTTDKYSDYSNLKSATTKIIVVKNNIQICYNELTLSVPSNNAQEFFNDGASIGECKSNPIESVKICYRDNEIFIEQTELQGYFDKGATEGNCKEFIKDETKAEVCYEGETVWVSAKSQIYQEAVLGKCNKKKTVELLSMEKIYWLIMVMGLIAGSIIVMANSAVPLLEIMPGVFGGSIVLRLNRLIGAFKGVNKDKLKGRIFEKSTHLPIVGAKIILVNSDRKNVANTRSDSEGNFSFSVNKGEYLLRVESSKYRIDFDKEDGLFETLYEQREMISVNDNKEESVIVNIAVSMNDMDMKSYGDQKIRQYTSAWSRIKIILFNMTYLIGFYVSIVTGYVHFATFSFIMIGLYTFILVSWVFLKKKNYGFIETISGKPISFAVVTVYDKLLEERYDFAVTDSIGRYFLNVENGMYKMNIRGQSASSAKFNKEKEVFVKNGVLNKDITI